MYVSITLDQSVGTFIRCHIQAFRYFGGVSQTVKLDNLKASIVEADFYEPTVQRTYAAFADHYGFLPDPCRVYTSTDKGKVESNWGNKYPASVASWRNNWPRLSTYFKYPPEIRKLIYTTNSIENFNHQLRKVTKSRTIFLTDDSLFKMLYLAMMDATKKWMGKS